VKSRGKRILAWGLCVVAVVGGVVHLVVKWSLLGWPPTPSDVVNDLSLGMVAVVFSVLAAVIIARQPGNRVGWLMMIIALAAGNPASTFAETLSGAPAAMTPGLWLALWLDSWAWVPVIFPILLIPLYFPTGRPPTPRWRWVSRLAVLMWIVFALLAAFAEEIGPATTADWTMTNPLGFVPQEFFNMSFFWVIWGIGLVALTLGSVASLFVRYRRAGADERQQIKWLLVAGVFFAVFYVLSVVLPDPARGTGWWSLLFFLAILCIPIAIAIAIFRYRLWDLEVVVNRALVYGLLTTLLAGIFAGGIALISEATKQLLGQGSPAAGAAISALIVAVVFQPLRTWIEAAVNRRFYPKKEDLASGLVEVQPEYWAFLDRPALLRLSMEHVSRVLGTHHAAFYLASEGGEFLLAQQVDGSAGGMTSVFVTEEECKELEKKRVIAKSSGSLVGHVPVYVDRGETNELLGLLSIGARENGKGYSGDDLKGLSALGGKIGLALNAIRLGSSSK